MVKPIPHVYHPSPPSYAHHLMMHKIFSLDLLWLDFLWLSDLLNSFLLFEQYHVMLKLSRFFFSWQRAKWLKKLHLFHFHSVDCCEKDVTLSVNSHRHGSQATKTGSLHKYDTGGNKTDSSPITLSITPSPVCCLIWD